MVGPLRSTAAGDPSTSLPTAAAHDRFAPVTIWIAGHGVVGGRVERMLRRRDVKTWDPRTEPPPPTERSDVVVLAQPGAHAPLARQVVEHGTSVVTVGDGLTDARELLALDVEFAAAEATLVVGAALAPGLSGLLARRQSDDLAVVDEIHVAVHGTAGPSCARQHHHSLRGLATSWRDGRWQYALGGSGRELCWFPEPVGARDCYLADTAGPLLLHHAFPSVDRVVVRRSARRRDRLTSRLPMLSPPHREGAIGALRVEVRGADAAGRRVTSVLGVAELVGTAAAATAAAFAEAAADRRLPVGAVTTADEAVDALAMLHRIQRFGIRLQEFTGVPQPRPARSA